MRTTKALSALPFALALSLGAVALGGCDSEGPAEQVGEKIDEAGKDAERATRDAAD